MVDFNGFDRGVIGQRLPADTTLNNMRKSELIDLLHLAEDNHRVLAEAYKIAVDTSKCNICPLHLDTRKAEDIRADERKKAMEEVREITKTIEAIDILKMAESCDKKCWECDGCLTRILFEQMKGEQK